MFIYDMPSKKQESCGNYFVPLDWQEPFKRPRGVEIKNGIYFLVDATPAKNVIILSAHDMLHLKELCFFLIWRYQKTYTREYFEQLHGKMFLSFQEYLEGKRNSLEGIPGMFGGILFGDKQYKFKQNYYVGSMVPAAFRGANLAMALSVDRVQGPTGNIIKNPQDMANAYKELKTILTQELDYMGQNPAFQQNNDQAAPQKI